MDYKDRWHIIDELGEGGQGKVYRVLDKSKFKVEQGIFPEVVKSIRNLTKISDDQKNRKALFESLRETVAEFNRMENPVNQGALKVLREPKDNSDPEKAEVRVKKEIEGMSKVSHPNLLKILDHDPDLKSFVSEFHPKGTLVSNKNWFTGNFVDSLRAFRPLVKGVSELHKNDLIHRDIKPQNVFLDSDNNLVLGDFGLLFSMYEEHTRISGMWENVGSRDWMPGWAMGIRIKEIRPTFDVFSLGKLLWAMVSNIPILQLWYFEEPENNLENMFPDTPSIKMANPLFRNCIVENPEDCLPDATALLKEVDKTLSIIDRNADLIGEDIKRPCRVCGIGSYQLVVDKDDDIGKLADFGFSRVSGLSFKLFTCDHCGHVQLFNFRGKQTPRAWST